MNQSEIANTIDELTGSWNPTGGATSEDLREARLRLADGLSNNTVPPIGQSTFRFRSRPLSVNPAAGTAASQLASSSLGGLPYLRSATDIDPTALANVAGMKIEKTLGPFVDSLGVSHWVDLIPIPSRIPVTSATRGTFGFLLIDVPSAKLGPGSIWISASAFQIPQLTAGVVGLSFSAGTVKRTGSVAVSSGGITIGAGGKLTLSLTLAPPPGASGLGPDAQKMNLNLPAHVTVEFTETGAAFSSIDNSAATVYGTACTLKRNASPPSVVNLGLQFLLFPCDASIAEFAFQTVLSTEVVPSGQATITNAGWALPITTAPPSQLGAASSAGALVLQLASGISLRFGDLVAPTALASVKLALTPDTILLLSTNGPREVVDRFLLWNPAPPAPLLEPAPDQHSSEIEGKIPRGALLFSIVSPQMEATVAYGKARANVDRPLASNGSRLPMAFSLALMAFVNTGSKALIIRMSAPDLSPGGSPRQAVIAMENALLRVGPAQSGLLHATYSGNRLVGALEFLFENVRILPILPDPYASANVGLLPISATVAALDTWTLKPGAALRFEMVTSAVSSATANTGPVLGAAVVETGTTLLDLSSNADQVGVSFVSTTRGSNVFVLDGMGLAAPQEFVSVYALPGVSWEPVVDKETNDWLDAPTPDDGPPTALLVRTANLVRIEPNILLPAFAYAGASADVLGRFTLPFGLIATLQVAASDPPNQRPSLSFVPGNYTSSGQSAARQLSIRAQSVIHVGDPALPGSTTTGSPLPVPLTSRVYGVLTLGNDNLGVAQYFDQEFASGQTAQIPVTRIDISGYGTSMFSDWRDPDLNIGVKRARFDVLVGRTAFELVQVATVIIPWCIRITRTVIFDRFDTGLVVRQDTGWKATGVGKFELLHGNQLLLGAVERLQNIHNIFVANGSTIVSGGKHFVPVTFDADILVGPSVTAISGGKISPLVAGTQIQGYAQLDVGFPPSAQDILGAIQQLPNGVSGSASCILNVGSAPAPNAPKFTLNVSSIVAKTTKNMVAGQTFPALALAFLGTPRLPRDGAWSITKRAQNDAQPSAIDPTFPIPLVFASNNDGKYQWRMLGPEDALSANSPGTVYGLMQGTGTSKTLFENPVVDTAGKSLLLDPGRGVPPTRLADIGSLLGASGIFPNLANVLQIPTSASDALNLVQDGFRKTFSWTLSKNSAGHPPPPLDDQKLLDLGVVSMVLQYHNGPSLASAKFTVDALPPAGQPRWSLEIDDLAAAVFVAGFGPDALLTIHGSFQANELTKAGFTNIQIDYGSALQLITNILQGIQDVVKAIGGSVNLDVGFSGNKLTVRDGFALPILPLGLGQLEHIGIDLGLTIEIPAKAEFTVGFASHDDPFTWIVDPLAGNGAIVLGTSGGDMGVFIEAGIGAALAINVAIASGSASIILDFSFSLQPPNLALAVALTGNATVDVLEGLTSVSLTLTAAITVVVNLPLPPTTADFIGSVAVGIHISIAWVVNVDFDGSWSFQQSVPFHAP